MHIILNDTLVENKSISSKNIQHKIIYIGKTMHPLPKLYDSSSPAANFGFDESEIELLEKNNKITFDYTVVKGDVESSLVNAGFVGFVSHCYSNHLPMAIAPHDIWVVLLSEISKEVASNAEEYRKFFTVSDKKEQIEVISNSLIEMPIETLSETLASKVLFDSSFIFQNFSTETPIITKTIQAIFCDMASPYYNYSMFLCGIPSIEILGTVEDWEKLLKGFETLVQTFNTKNLNNYLNTTQPIIQKFIDASKGNFDTEYWKDIFTQKNMGSGGDLFINGWINKLFITQHEINKIDNFTTTYGVVKYTQSNTKQEFVAIYGGFHEKINDNGFHQLEYSDFILQKVKYTYRFTK